MKMMLAACAALLAATGSAHATDTFTFTVDGIAWHDADVAACEADPMTCVQISAPLHSIYTYSVPGDGDWYFDHGGLSVRNGQVTDFFQNMGTCDTSASDWSVWHDCTHGQLIDEQGIAFGYYRVYGDQPDFIISAWSGDLTVSSSTSAVPEPGSTALFLAGGALLALRRRRD